MKKEIISSSKVRAPVAGFPVATRAGHLLFISGRVGLDSESGLPLTGYAQLGRKPVPSLGLLAPDSWEETFVAQAARMYEDLETLLAEQGAQKTDLLFYSIYAREMRNFPVIVRTRAALFEGGVAPPSTASQVPGLLYPGAVVYFDPVAVIPDAGSGIAKKVLTSRHVVQGPLSNYELATRAGDYTFYAGVVGAHPETGTIVYGGKELKDETWPKPQGGLATRLLLEPTSAQTYTILKLMRSMLEEHGGGLDRVLRTNIYLRSMTELPEVERVAGRFFGTRAPAGTVIGVESLARGDFFIEIEAITYDRGATRASPADTQVASWGRYANAVRGGDLVFVSGLLGYDAASNRIVKRAADLGSSAAERVNKAIGGSDVQTAGQLAAAAQTQSILDQLARVLKSLDSNPGSLLKLTVYLREMSEFPYVKNVLLATLGENPPAISVLAVQDLPLKEARVQIEATAV
ncbi:MAG TPA: RidA family protein [Burkholderiales bacterium]|nr:RidA family protein [Burkholderiales bacterium]